MPKLGERAFGRIKIVGRHVRTVLDEPFVMKAVQKNLVRRIHTSCSVPTHANKVSSLAFLAAYFDFHSWQPSRRTIFVHHHSKLIRAVMSCQKFKDFQVPPLVLKKCRAPFFLELHHDLCFCAEWSMLRIIHWERQEYILERRKII